TALFIGGITFSASSQSVRPLDNKWHYKFEASTILTEKTGTYDQRLLRRELLTEYMKNCPHIHHFKIMESGTESNLEVIWTYEVKSWNDITEFYDWIYAQLKTSNDKIFEKLLAPFASDYALGGQIFMRKRMKTALAKE
ncbi:MAG: hypothetical protein ACRDE2_07555, partial [Chitinophagaceae bacterium]